MTEYIVVGAPSGELGEEFMRLWLNGNSALGREFICTYRCRTNELYFVFRPVDNAALRAAAPELLAAAKALSNEARADSIEPEFIIDPQTLAELDGAIAKAERKQ